MTVAEFLARWRAAGAAERANKDSFLSELCDVLGVPRPDPKANDPERDRYVFEKEVARSREGGASIGRIDLYRAGAFVLEAKQVDPAKRDTPAWHQAMNDAHGQALGYARSLPEPPPFVVVCDLGYCFDLYACFDGSGAYRPFPDAFRKRLFVTDLERHVPTLRALWLDPLSLDPSREQARVTREVAAKIAALARELETAGHAPETVARFLMRCLFTMFAEDVGLLAGKPFSKFLAEYWIPNPPSFPGGVAALWSAMNDGGDTYMGRVLRFNGGLFRESTALPLPVAHLRLLAEAARSDWSQVDPSIFGTLLERALDAGERHRLGAHYTPRAYVERLVRPTIEEPLRADWDLVRAEVRSLVEKGEVATAQKRVIDFHRRLCRTRVLDPACGTGNFLYVTLDLFKRLESEVLALLAGLGYDQLHLEMERWSVTPEQFRGIEVKPWAKEIAELVLWIGYLQWQVRQSGEARTIPEPVLKDYRNIECRDAVLAWDGDPELARDEHGKPLTRWDGVSTKPSLVTGEPIPDESQTIPIFAYRNPRPATWPQADFIIGNPPYIGNKRMRQALGDGYVESLRAAHDDVPENADYVMYWWNRAAALVRAGKARRFGLITTNSITQTFNRRVVKKHLEEKDNFSIVYAIPDHPWIDEKGSASVRVAMTVGEGLSRPGRLVEVASETPTKGAEVQLEFRHSEGFVHPDLRVGADVTSAISLRANSGLSGQGMKIVGDGFFAPPGLSLEPISPVTGQPIVRPLVGTRNVLEGSDGRLIIDFFGLDHSQAKALHPEAFQQLLVEVKPFRDQNQRDSIRELWWRFGWERPVLRMATRGLPRYIVTPATSRHRFFVFLSSRCLWDGAMFAVASADASHLAVLSSRLQKVWSSEAGGRIGVGNDLTWTNMTCFDPFPFPNASVEVIERLRGLGEQLDAHRKARQEEHAGLTITGMYNVLEKLRSGGALTPKEKVIHGQGLVSVLKQIHDELDAAVFEAYGWPPTLTDEEILERLIALNHDRAEEERRGLVRWLRPDFQNPGGTTAGVQAELPSGVGKGSPVAGPAKAEKREWPKELPLQVAALRDLLDVRGTLDIRSAKEAFRGARIEPLVRTLESLAALGIAVASGEGRARVWASNRQERNTLGNGQNR